MESAIGTRAVPGWFAWHVKIRTDGYVLLACLLGGAPSTELLHILRSLAWDEGAPAGMDASLKELGQVARDIPPAALEDEFNRLFVGPGRGELVPYASWYRERKIQFLPLASLRADLRLLGIVRQAECPEPEDHAGALCETMALISREESCFPHAVQAEFFRTHVSPWMMTFFQDLQSAAGEDFYRVVGKFGESFLKSEDEYLRYAGGGFPMNDGGLHNEPRIFQQPAGLS